ncbi:MAG: hypothetical protein RIR77_760, partial [Planctomycetota bacterium]
GQQPALLIDHQEVFIRMQKFVPASIHPPMVLNRCRSPLSLIFNAFGRSTPIRQFQSICIVRPCFSMSAVPEAMVPFARNFQSQALLSARVGLRIAECSHPGSFTSLSPLAS